MRYENRGNCISMDIDNNYTCTAIYNRGENDNEYVVDLYLSEETVPDLIHVDVMNVTSDRNKVKTTLCDLLTEKFYEGYFNKQIDRYDYMQQCFIKGNEIFERTEIR